MPRCQRPIAQVRVLAAVVAEVLVEAAGLARRLAGDADVAGPEAGPVVAASGVHAPITEDELCALQVPHQGVVERRRRLLEASEHRDLRLPVGGVGLQMPLHQLGMGDTVVVHEQHPIAPQLPQPGVARGGQTGVLLGHDAGGHAELALGEQLRRAVARAVVHHHQLVAARRALGLEGVEAALEGGPPLMGADQHREARGSPATGGAARAPAAPAPPPGRARPPARAQSSA